MNELQENLGINGLSPDGPPRLNDQLLKFLSTTFHLFTDNVNLMGIAIPCFYYMCKVNVFSKRICYFVDTS